MDIKKMYIKSRNINLSIKNIFIMYKLTLVENHHLEIARLSCGDSKEYIQLYHIIIIIAPF